MTNAIARDAILSCIRCPAMFDRDGRAIAIDIVGDRDEYVFTCPSCKPTADAEVLERRLRSSCLPAALQGLTFDPGDDRSACAAAREWGAGAIQGVLLHGPVGTGKTHLAATAVAERLRREPVRWVSVPSLIARALAALDSDERRSAVEELTGSGTVVLDDLDKVKPSEWVLAQLIAAIDSRVQSGAGLFVTTNLGPAGLLERLGEPIASRLMDQSRGVVCKLDGRDRRLSSIEGELAA